MKDTRIGDVSEDRRGERVAVGLSENEDEMVGVSILSEYYVKDVRVDTSTHRLSDFARIELLKWM